MVGSSQFQIFLSFSWERRKEYLSSRCDEKGKLIFGRHTFLEMASVLVGIVPSTASFPADQERQYTNIFLFCQRSTWELFFSKNTNQPEFCKSSAVPNFIPSSAIFHFVQFSTISRGFSRNPKANKCNNFYFLAQIFSSLFIPKTSNK